MTWATVVGLALPTLITALLAVQLVLALGKAYARGQEANAAAAAQLKAEDLRRTAEGLRDQANAQAAKAAQERDDALALLAQARQQLADRVTQDKEKTDAQIDGAHGDDLVVASRGVLGSHVPAAGAAGGPARAGGEGGPAPVPPAR